MNQDQEAFYLDITGIRQVENNALGDGSRNPFINAFGLGAGGGDEGEIRAVNASRIDLNTSTKRREREEKELRRKPPNIYEVNLQMSKLALYNAISKSNCVSFAGLVNGFIGEKQRNILDNPLFFKSDIASTVFDVWFSRYEDSIRYMPPPGAIQEKPYDSILTPSNVTLFLRDLVQTDAGNISLNEYFSVLKELNGEMIENENDLFFIFGDYLNAGRVTAWTEVVSFIYDKMDPLSEGFFGASTFLKERPGVLNFGFVLYYKTERGDSIMTEFARLTAIHCQKNQSSLVGTKVTYKQKADNEKDANINILKKLKLMGFKFKRS